MLGSNYFLNFRKCKAARIANSAETRIRYNERKAEFRALVANILPIPVSTKLPTITIAKLKGNARIILSING